MQQVNQIGKSPNLVNQLMSKNPDVSGLLGKYNGDGRAAFYDKARSMGYQDNEINEFVNKLYEKIGSLL